MMEYADFLKRNVFKVEEYDQFNLLFDTLPEIQDQNSSGVALLERSYIYGGKSIFAGLMPDVNAVHVIDYRPTYVEGRSAYQESWLDNSGFHYPLAESAIVDTGAELLYSFDHLDVDILAIPNVLHHCRDFPALISGLRCRLPGLKRVFVYDSYLREQHQAPDDYCRYTPSALEDVMDRNGFKVQNSTETGNVFDAILYFISQAQRNLSLDGMEDIRALLEDQVVPKLRTVRSDAGLRPLGRKYASLATAYAMVFTLA